MKNLIYIFSIIITLNLVSCEDVDPVITGSQKETINDLTIGEQGENLLITWELPQSSEELSVKIYVDDNDPITVSGNPTTYVLSNVIPNVEMAITVKVLYLDGSISQGITQFFTKEGTNAIENFEGVWNQKDLEINLSWELPENNAGNEILIKWTYSDGKNGERSVYSSETSYTIENVEMNTIYSISAQTTNGELLSNIISINVPTPKEWIGTKIGFVIVEADIDELTDDDEIAAAYWFVNKYPEGNVISVADIATGAVNLEDYKVLWLHRDRLYENAQVPAELLSSDVLDLMTNYLKDGGNLLLSIHATRYLPHLGRISMDRMPGILGAGEGGSGDDVWLVNAHIGYAFSGSDYNRADHPIYNNVVVDDTYYSDHSAIPFIGPGQREDHNSMWDLNSFGYSIPGDGANVVKAFEAENDATVLGTWGQVSDYCCAGIVDFAPSKDYFGRCVAVGLAAYEWNQNSGVNIYQENIENFTESCITYLQNN
ncbi:DUF4960 domain-containing protein [Plebeiibacterium sediminum]|uniref:DUF4960 domain-containing protein n=1 Tax=Plebeiibacterium sediminum TaxID=2992112 RepID=A0AAE3SG23_9BACT|nr:DUF4960 domain-containing protein [Plebeiobacterium sediminum]MCW3787682.1 DUF4960 domain-containing protein [Plebeiobacterium sediminum]